MGGVGVKSQCGRNNRGGKAHRWDVLSLCHTETRRWWFLLVAVDVGGCVEHMPRDLHCETHSTRDYLINSNYLMFLLGGSARANVLDPRLESQPLPFSERSLIFQFLPPQVD